MLKLNDILNATGDPIFVKDYESKFVVVNDALCNLLGLNRECIIGKTLVEHLPKSEMEHFLKIDREVLESGIENICEEYLTGKARVHTIVTKKTRYIDDQGNKFLVGIMQDITEKKIIENDQKISETKYRMLVENLNEGIWYIDKDSTTTFVNQHMAEILGYTVEEMIGKTLFNFMDDDGIKLAKEHVARRQSGIREKHEFEFIKKDGRRIYALLTTAPINDENGKYVGAIAGVQDITETKIANERIFHQASLLQQVTDAVITTDLQYKITFWNTAAEKMYGWLSSEVVGQALEKFITNDYLGESLENVLNSIFKIGYWKGEVTQNSRNGLRIPILAIVSAIIKDDKIIGYIAVNRDISEYKKSEKALRESEEILNQFLLYSPSFIYIKDEQLKLVKISKNMEALLGKSTKELIGKDAFEHLPSEFAEIAIAADMKVLKENKIVEYEEKINEKIYATIKFPIQSAGVATHVAGFSIDISSKKEAEQERQKYEQQLQQTQRLESLGLLAGGIAHDFNNMLAAIFGYIDLAKANTAEDITKDFLSKSMSMMNRAKALTQQLLTFAKGGEPIKRPTSLDFIVDTVNFALSGSNIICKFKITKNQVCNIDMYQISQVISNLVINAQQAMLFGGNIEISTLNTKTDGIRKGNYAKISVSDNGIGISKENLNKVFEPFYTTKPTGHGLGLPICFSIINKHGGRITVESVVSKGTTVTIYLPLIDAVAEQEKDTQKTYKGSGKILVMDDEEALRDVISAMLEEFGYNVDLASDGDEAIKKFNSSIYTAVILDLTIPGGMGGEEVSEEIRKINKKIPIFIASGYSSEKIMSRAGSSAFTDCLQKPFSMDKLAIMLQKLS